VVTVTVPGPAELARTALAAAPRGALASLAPGQQPLATQVSFVLLDGGSEGAGAHPVLRLRADAEHTANLDAEPRCSLLAQTEGAAQCLARLTLVGRAEPLEDELVPDAQAAFLASHGAGVGVDALQEDDHYVRLRVEEAFLVSLLGHAREAATVPLADYEAALPDPLLECAPGLVEMMNLERIEDVVRFAQMATGITLEELEDVRFMWVDSKGFYLRAKRRGEAPVDARLGFPREVSTEKDAVSELTMLSQIAWEQVRG